MFHCLKKKPMKEKEKAFDKIFEKKSKINICISL
jgi:hypothetical protein